MKLTFAALLAGFALVLSGCSTAEQDAAPEPAPGHTVGGANNPVPVGESSPTTGGALFNGN
jgi:hypothetical protein